MAFGFNTIVRCRAGHLFTTTWIPLVSVKAIRMGRRRFQRCPVCNRWTTIRRVDVDTLTADEVREASLNQGPPIP